MLFIFRTIFFFPSATSFCNSSRRASPSAPSTTRPSSASTDAPSTSRFVIFNAMLISFLPVHDEKKCRVVLSLSKPAEKGQAKSPPPPRFAFGPGLLSDPLPLPRPPCPAPAFPHLPFPNSAFPHSLCSVWLWLPRV